MFRRRTEIDTRLVQEALAGSETAFGALVDRYSSTVFGLALAHLRNWADAEDLTQEVFAAAYESLHTLREHKKFSGWLTTLTRNRCRNALKRRGLEQALPEKLGESQKEVRPHPGQDELYRFLHNEMDALSADAREALILYYFSRRGTREIGQILGVSRGAVGKRLERARRALGERLLVILGEEMLHRDQPSERKTRVMGVVSGLSPEWMKAAGGSVALETAGTPPLIVGALLMKAKMIFVALVLALGALGYLALPRDNEQKFEPSLGVEREDGSPESLAVKTPPTLAKSEEPLIELREISEALRENPPRAAAEGASICEILEPSRFASISGTVTDKAGDPVPGVEVLVACYGIGDEPDNSRPAKSSLGVYRWLPHMMDAEHALATVSGSTGAYRVSLGPEPQEDRRGVEPDIRR